MYRSLSVCYYSLVREGEVLEKSAIQRSKDKYQRESVDRVVFYVDKGGKKAIQDAAEASGVSVNHFIVDTLQERIQQPLKRDRRKE